MTDPIRWENDTLSLLDQRLLPHEKTYVVCDTLAATASAITDMVVRGAPAIGITAAFGVVVGLREGKSIDEVIDTLGATRPTAVNLFWALTKMRQQVESRGTDGLAAYAMHLMNDDIAVNRKIGTHGEKVISSGASFLTHCNAGALATAGYGTALGVFRAAKEAGKDLHVYVDETRPYLQGSRLTAFEMAEEGIPHTLICDNMAGMLMKQGRVDGVCVGADRIAANGDAANKIGTYAVAVLAKHHGIPFYIAAPTSTIDMDIPNGDHIPIEMRSADEVRHCGGTLTAAADVDVYNPAFDVTPAELITGIITERGIASGGYSKNISHIMSGGTL